MKADIKKRASHRLKILQGQLKGLEKMIEQEDYCTDILTQNLAVQKSLSSLNKLILESHLQTHIREKFMSRSEKNKQEAITELLELYELNNRRSK